MKERPWVALHSTILQTALHMPPRNLTVIVLAIILSLACYRRASRNRYAATIAEAMGRVDDHFVESVDHRELFEGSMRGMIRQLDPYSGYVAEEDYKRLLESMEQQFGGVGMVVDMDQDSGRPLILSPQHDSPAYKAGIRAGDVIWAIDGEDTADLDRDAAISRIRGEPGSSVVLTVLSVGATDTKDLSIERAIIPVDSVMGYSRRSDGSWDFRLADRPEIGYLWVDSFGEETGAEIKKALDELLPEVEGLIFDLRRNAGGLLSAAVEVCDLFVSDGPIVTIKGRDGRLRAEFVADDHDDLIETKVPIAVLVDHYSASAAEIFAACLQDHGLAKVVGERSWGKGTVQNVIELEGGRSAMRLTTATYWRPSGKNIHRSRKATEEDEWGVSPDEGLEVSFEEEQLQQFLASQRARFSAPIEAAEAEEKPETETPPFVDIQLEKAIDYLEKQWQQPAEPVTKAAA
jgi:carboxyl-terminal processing protease